VRDLSDEAFAYLLTMRGSHLRLVISFHHFRHHLMPERFHAQICQPDVCHSVRRITRAFCDKSAADQSLVPHQEQVFEYLAFFAKMFQVIVAHG